MLKIATFIAFVYLLLQNSDGYPPQNRDNSSPIHEAIQEINPKLDKISQRLKTLKIELLKTSLEKQIEIQKSSIFSAQQLLNSTNNFKLNETNNECIVNLNDKIEKILTVANTKTNQNIENGLQKITNLTQNITNLINKADDIDKNINKIIGYCVRQNNLVWQKERLKICLLNETKLINEVVDKLYQEKNSIVDVNAKNDSHIMKWFSKVEQEYNGCISNSTNPPLATKFNFQNVSMSESSELLKKIKSVRDLIGELRKSRQNGNGKNLNSTVNESLFEKNEKYILYISL